MALEKITIDADCQSIAEKIQLEKICAKLVKLGADDRSRLMQIIDSPKALKGLKDNWMFLKLKMS